MRAVWNTTCDVYNGPGAALPNAYRGTISCRFVPNQRILPLTAFWTGLLGHITYNSPIITAGPSSIVGTTVGFNASLSSRVIVASTGLTYMVYWLERVTPLPGQGAVYRRAWLGPIIP